MDDVLDVARLRKDYRGLRPLRIAALRVGEQEIVALMGIDALAAEVLVNLLTGATLPDEGEVRVFGESTRDIADGDAWLARLDRFGIVSDRAVLLEELSVAQNLAVPLTLDLNPLAGEVAAAVRRLADEVTLDPATLDTPVRRATPESRLRVRLARAIALDPRVIVAEHATATLPRASVASFACDFERVARGRHLTVVAITEDRAFAEAVADRVLTLQPATGNLTNEPAWRRVIRRLRRGRWLRN